MPGGMTPTSPRPIQVDPHLPPPPRSHAITISSPNALSPSRAIGTVGQHAHAGHPAPLHPPLHRGGSSGMVGRSYRDRDDPETARERQMQQDIESAMSMSRARSGSVTNHDTSPVARPSQMHFPSTSPIDEGPFPMLSELEEAEMDRARQAGFRDHGDGGSDDGHHYDSHNVHHEHEEERGEGMMDLPRGSAGGSSGYDSHARLLPDGHGRDGGRGRQEVQGRQVYDFAAMEEFAAKEREELDHVASVGGRQASGTPQWIKENSGGGVRRRSGLQTDEVNGNGTNQPGSYDTAMERTHTMSAFGDDNDHDDVDDLQRRSRGGDDTLASESAFSPDRNSVNHFHRRRQRKLSQSNPVQRRQGKLALFEGFGAQGTNPVGELPADSPSGAFKAPRQPKNLGGGGNGFVPFTDAAPGHDRPYRFSFYSNALPVTIHARTLAELPAEGQSFEDLFKGRDSELNNRATNEANGTDYGSVKGSGIETPTGTANGEMGLGGKMSLLSRAAGAAMVQAQKAGPGGGGGGGGKGDEDPEAFTWWLDVLSPTDEEMRMLSRVFGIHPLTTEDILLEETREKIELFRNYYLVCFRSFDQDPYSQTYLEPLNMYIIVFREGTLSFHFRGTPHPQNVRRRIKHLRDYISVTSDWISYALIDDITDAFGPLIQSIEYEVDSIDELVLILKEAEQSDMLRRIGTCRKKVMGLLRLMGNKADVVKGLAKRCNEQWLVAPKSDIGLYLSDIQDHLITMTQNLNHYEKILSRSHSNYLAQISIEMTDANNQINDVLSKLTALGTVLIPMNLVTGLWGMNVHVPGQDIDTGYAWFGGILGCLALFAVLGAFATWKCFVR